jgi:hypothetical protein
MPLIDNICGHIISLWYKCFFLQKNKIKLVLWMQCHKIFRPFQNTRPTNFVVMSACKDVVRTAAVYIVEWTVLRFWNWVGAMIGCGSLKVQFVSVRNKNISHVIL